MAVSRNEILGRLRAQVEAGKPIIGCGAGTGISAKFAEAGGADLLIIYNSGRYRMAGRSSLAGFFAYGDANSIVMEMAGEVLPVVQNTPVLAGVNGTDPFKIMPHFLRQVKEIGFSGVQNFPTMGMFDGIMRANMEATGLGYDKEVEMIRMAHEMDMFTSPYVFNADEARWMVEAGGDLIVCHVGLTTAGSIGASVAMTL
ncbi:MAG: phosphoenolpyruvate hydrolase family protein, partial [Anaerolinea sp.]|nr:phosphoenolpyruvate hydrolase family protein [Anaerolinea sp.]